MAQNKENLMGSYETIFICDLNLGEEGVKNLVAKFTKMISDSGELTGCNEWGKRRFAYPINDISEGYYVLATFKAPHEFPVELQRVFNITEGIMRSMIVAVDHANANSAEAAAKISTPPIELVIEDEESGNPPKQEYNANIADSSQKEISVEADESDEIDA